MSQDLLTTLMVIAVAVFIGGLLILIGLLALDAIKAWRARRQSPDPRLDAIFLALQPWLYRAIFAGERAAIWGLEEIDQLLGSIDKKEVADSVYALLPNTIIIDGFPIPIGKIKTIVTADVFAGWVKQVYDEAHAFLLANETYLKNQVFEDAPSDTKTVDSGEYNGIEFHADH